MVAVQRTPPLSHSTTVWSLNIPDKHHGRKDGRTDKVATIGSSFGEYKKTKLN